MSKMIRVRDDVYEALLDRKHKMDSMSDVIGELLAELGIEPFDEEYEE